MMTIKDFLLLQRATEKIRHVANFEFYLCAFLSDVHVTNNHGGIVVES